MYHRVDKALRRLNIISEAAESYCLMSIEGDKNTITVFIDDQFFDNYIASCRGEIYGKIQLEKYKFSESTNHHIELARVANKRFYQAKKFDLQTNKMSA